MDRSRGLVRMEFYFSIKEIYNDCFNKREIRIEKDWKKTDLISKSHSWELNVMLQIIFVCRNKCKPFAFIN